MLFKCKQFDVIQSDNVFKITTDATLLGALAWNDKETLDFQVQILEVGSGTGIISLMLAQRFPYVNIHAIDINENAVRLSKRNFDNSKFKNRIKAFHNDILNISTKYDRIIINPPYFQNDTKSENVVQKESRHLNGMNYSILITKLIKLLKVNGSIEMLHPNRYIDSIEKIVKSNKASINRIIKIRHHENTTVKNCISRISIQNTNQKKVAYFNIKDMNGKNSSEYTILLRPFLFI